MSNRSVELVIVVGIVVAARAWRRRRPPGGVLIEITPMGGGRTPSNLGWRLLASVTSIPPFRTFPSRWVAFRVVVTAISRRYFIRLPRRIDPAEVITLLHRAGIATFPPVPDAAPVPDGATFTTRRFSQFAMPPRSYNFLTLFKGKGSDPLDEVLTVGRPKHPDDTFIWDVSVRQAPMWRVWWAQRWSTVNSTSSSGRSRTTPSKMQNSPHWIAAISLTVMSTKAGAHSRVRRLAQAAAGTATGHLSNRHNTLWSRVILIGARGILTWPRLTPGDLLGTDELETIAHIPAAPTSPASPTRPVPPPPNIGTPISTDDDAEDDVDDL